MTTFFNYTDSIQYIMSDIYGRLIIGVIPVIILFVLIYKFIRSKERKASVVFIFLFLIIWSGGWFAGHFPYFLKLRNKLSEIHMINDLNQWTVVEGNIKLFHIQPETGHSSGDKIEVGGKVFEIDYFDATPRYAFGYRRTINHGGVLTEGRYVRLKTYEGAVYQIDIQ